MIKVFIADDHAIFREGLKNIIKEASDIIITGEARDVAEVLAKIGKIDFDILILDLNMPGRGGLDLIRELRSQIAGIRILVLSYLPEDKFALRSIKAGANGYVSKESAVEELITAIRRIFTRGKYLSPAMAEQLAFENLSPSGQLPHTILSNREFEILCMIASNNSIRKISVDLSLCVSTVNTYRARILKKMDMKTDVELTHYAIEQKLVD